MRRRGLICGCFCSSTGDEPVAKSSLQEHQVGKDVISILFLGIGFAGKTTMIKNLKMTHGTFDNTYKRHYDLCDRNYLVEKAKPLLYQSFFGNLIQVLKLATHRGQPFDSATNREAAEKISLMPDRELKLMQTFPSGLEETISRLWEDSAVKAAYGERRNYRISGNITYFIRHLHRIASTDYVPTSDDLLYIRRNTEAESRHYFVIDKYRYFLRDIGGTVKEREQWPTVISRFSDELLASEAAAKVIIFVASLADYDQAREPRCPSEAEMQHPRYNRPYTEMDESVSIFRLLVDYEALRDKKIILFLNKEDVFRDRLIEFQDFDTYYPDAHTQNDPQKCKRYLQGLFEAEMRTSRHRQDGLRTLYTCATDRCVMRVVFNAAKEQIIDEILGRFGAA